jgi:hypothetical protein
MRSDTYCLQQSTHLVRKKYRKDVAMSGCPRPPRLRASVRMVWSTEISGAHLRLGAETTIQRATLTNLQSVWSGSKDLLVDSRTASCFREDGPGDTEISGAHLRLGSATTIQRATLTNLQSVWSGSKDLLVDSRTASGGAAADSIRG